MIAYIDLVLKVGRYLGTVRSLIVQSNQLLRVAYNLSNVEYDSDSDHEL